MVSKFNFVLSIDVSPESVRGKRWGQGEKIEKEGQRGIEIKREHSINPPNFPGFPPFYQPCDLT